MSDLTKQINKIPSGSPKEKSLDYEFLRSSGVKLLEKLTGKVWTDYNAHDPGITILEALCFALTEISLKANQPIEDLIASSEGPMDGMLNPPELLSNAPLSKTDLRKVLVDLPEIKNVWLTPWKNKSEIPFYFDETAIELNYNGGSLIKPKGLWEILFEFTEDALNTNVISRELPVIDDREYVMDIVFPYWDQLDSRSVGSAELAITAVTLLDVPGEAPGTLIKVNGSSEFLSMIRLDYDAGIFDEFPIYIKVIPGILPAHLPTFINQNPAVNPILVQLNTFVADSILDEFNSKNNASRSLIEMLRQFVNNRRNLCEDFAFLRTVRTQEIAIRADLELHPDSDIVDTLAEILFQVDQFLSPIIKHKDFKTSLNDNGTISKVYDGPLLENGFLYGREFEGFDRFDSKDGEQIIFNSDISGLIKNLNGSDRLRPGSEILDIKNLSLSNYINNILVTEGARNCLKLTQSNLYKPKLSPTKSVIQVFQFGIIVEVNLSEVLQRFDEKIAEALSEQTSFSTDEMSMPVGESVPLSEYNAIQFDFPITYKIKPGELVSTDPPEVIGKVKQLKAYLSFYDQILLNSTQQLLHLNELFAVNPTDERTYFFESLATIPGIEDLLTGTYAADLQDIHELEETRLLRRNKFLDHLLARYCEDPADFRILQTFFLNLHPTFNSLTPQNQQTILSQISLQILQAKRTFLGEYLELSAERARAFNYLQQAEGGGTDVWDTSNVSGFEKRLSRLLAIENYNRRTLSDITTGNPGEGEGMHLVELVLLRPRSNGLGDIVEIDELLNAEVKYDTFPDPYSFVVTIIFPSGFERDFSDTESEQLPIVESQRFQFLNFRTHIEQLIRRELPAHVLFHIFWLDRNTSVTNNLDIPSLNEFESAFQGWLETTADTSSDEVARINARADLIRILNLLLRPNN